MSVCCCSMAGTAACQHCRNNPMATDVWPNTITTVHIEDDPSIHELLEIAKRGGYDAKLDAEKGTVAFTPRKQTNYDLIRNMSVEELAAWIRGEAQEEPWCKINTDAGYGCAFSDDYPCVNCVVDWLKQEVDK